MPPRRQEIFVWWTTLGECQTLGVLPKDLPDYVHQAYQARVTAGDVRSRIFPSERLPKVEISEWPKTLIGALVHNTSSGVAVLGADLPLLKTLPGIVTDLRVRMMVLT